MNKVTKYYYQQLLWAIEEADMNDAVDSPQDALDQYHTYAALATRDFAGRTAMDNVTLNGAVEELALQLIRIFEFNGQGDPEKIKKKINSFF